MQIQLDYLNSDLVKLEEEADTQIKQLKEKLQTVTTLFSNGTITQEQLYYIRQMSLEVQNSFKLAKTRQQLELLAKLAKTMRQIAKDSQNILQDSAKQFYTTTNSKTANKSFTQINEANIHESFANLNQSTFPKNSFVQNPKQLGAIIGQLTLLQNQQREQFCINQRLVQEVATLKSQNSDLQKNFQALKEQSTFQEQSVKAEVQKIGGLVRGILLQKDFESGQIEEIYEELLQIREILNIEDDEDNESNIQCQNSVKNEIKQEIKNKDDFKQFIQKDITNQKSQIQNFDAIEVCKQIMITQKCDVKQIFTLITQYNNQQRVLINKQLISKYKTDIEKQIDNQASYNAKQLIISAFTEKYKFWAFQINQQIEKQQELNCFVLCVLMSGEELLFVNQEYLNQFNKQLIDELNEHYKDIPYFQILINILSNKEEELDIQNQLQILISNDYNTDVIANILSKTNYNQYDQLIKALKQQFNVDLRQTLLDKHGVTYVLLHDCIISPTNGVAASLSQSLLNNNDEQLIVLSALFCDGYKGQIIKDAYSLLFQREIEEDCKLIQADFLGYIQLMWQL